MHKYFFIIEITFTPLKTMSLYVRELFVKQRLCTIYRSTNKIINECVLINKVKMCF